MNDDTTLSEEEVMVRETARKFWRRIADEAGARDGEDPKAIPRCGSRRRSCWQDWHCRKIRRREMPLTYLAWLEEVGRAIAPLPLHSTVSRLCRGARRNEALCSRCAGVAAGDAVLTWLSTNRIRCWCRKRCNARRWRRDDFVINGNKLFVDNYVVADHCLVVCRTAPRRRRAPDLFLVDTKSAACRRRRLLASPRQDDEVKFQNVRVPKAT